MPPVILPPGDERTRAGERLGFVSDRMNQIVAAADGRDLTKSQAADFAGFYKESRRLLDLTGQHLSIFDSPDGTAIAAEAARSLNDLMSRPGGEPVAGRPGAYASAERSQILRPEQRMAEHVSPSAPGVGLTMGRFVRALVTGDWSGIDPEARAMSLGAGAAGGYIVPDGLSARVIDLARDAAVVVKAGAITVPMNSSELVMARLAGDASGSWKQENAPAAPSDLSFERITFRARTLVAIVKASVELIEDAVTVEGAIEKSLGAALALELDRAALRGTGSAAEPLGILYQPGVTITGSIGSPADYVKFADTPTRTLREANAAEPYAFISAPRTFESLDKLVTGIAGDKTRLAPPPAWNAYRKFSTNQIPINLGAGSNESEAYVGDFAQVMLGMRTQLTIEVSRQAADATGSAFSNLQVWIRAYLRADVQLAHPDHFDVLTGVLA